LILEQQRTVAEEAIVDEGAIGGVAVGRMMSDVCGFWRHLD
jgi:hypothetical protein